ncbi:MAG: hypothetical protein FJ361_01380 [Gemmatimonadetes bacterium]|nr:hypothetical protein [Gemmatimonadota bacterium]
MPTSRFVLHCLAAIAVAAPVAAQEATMTASGNNDSSYRAPAVRRGAGPNGATLKCRDGSHPAANAPASACDGKGGVLLRYPMLRIPARPTTPATVKAPEPPRPATPARPTAVRAAPAATIPTGEPPADATQICRDGTMIRVDTTTAACAAHGGVALKLRRRSR